jgi:ribosomal protein S18 acetylase RimI-like enzyme
MPPFETLGQLTVSFQMTVRLCREADLPALEWMGLFTHDRDIIREAFEAQQRGDALMLLGVAAGFPVGQVWIDLATKRDEKTAILWAVRTFPPLQCAGIGRCLMLTACDMLGTRGICRAELEVDRANVQAMRFYERLGWRLAEPALHGGEAQGAPANSDEPECITLNKKIRPPACSGRPVR